MVNEYFEIKNEKSYYVDVKSNKQIKTLVKYAKNNDQNIINRLLILLGKNINPFFMNKLFNLVTSNNNDDYIYNELIKLQSNYPKKKKK